MLQASLIMSNERYQGIKTISLITAFGGNNLTLFDNTFTELMPMELCNSMMSHSYINVTKYSAV